jgi:hypothetical protein
LLNLTVESEDNQIKVPKVLWKLLIKIPKPSISSVKL